MLSVETARARGFAYFFGHVLNGKRPFKQFQTERKINVSSKRSLTRASSSIFALAALVTSMVVFSPHAVGAAAVTGGGLINASSGPADSDLKAQLDKQIAQVEEALKEVATDFSKCDASAKTGYLSGIQQGKTFFDNAKELIGKHDYEQALSKATTALKLIKNAANVYLDDGSDDDAPHYCAPLNKDSGGNSSTGTPTSPQSHTGGTTPSAQGGTTPASPSGGEATSRSTAVEGNLNWSVRDSFLKYIQGPIAHGTVETAGGATAIKDQNGTVTSFSFKTVSDQKLDVNHPSNTLQFQGTVHLIGHGGILEMTISNPAIQLTKANDAAGGKRNGVLSAEVKSRRFVDTTTKGELVDYNRIEIANLQNIDARTSGDSMTIKTEAATLLQSGVAAFGGFYSARENLAGIAVSLKEKRAHESTQPAQKPNMGSYRGRCKADEPRDTRVSKAKLEVIKPKVVDAGKEMKFTLKGSGFNDPEDPVGNGVYVLVTQDDEWVINECLTLTGPGGLYSGYIPKINSDGTFEHTITIAADNFIPGRTYAIGTLAAHAASLNSRYFDRGIMLKIPEVTSKTVTDPKSVKATVDAKKNVKVQWDVAADTSGQKWRVSINCIDKCSDKFGRTTRAADKWKSADREHVFEDADNGIYIPKVQAYREVGEERVYGQEIEGQRFAVGIELPKESELGNNQQPNTERPPEAVPKPPANQQPSASTEPLANRKPPVTTDPLAKKKSGEVTQRAQVQATANPPKLKAVSTDGNHAPGRQAKRLAATGVESMSIVFASVLLAALGAGVLAVRNRHS